jgi:hypothetical protein
VATQRVGTRGRLPTQVQGRTTLFRGAIDRGQGDLRLPLDGASFEDGCIPSARTPQLAVLRPDVSPPCPEHGGLASSVDVR